MCNTGQSVCNRKSLLPGEHSEYSLGFSFSLLLYKILVVLEVGLHLFKIRSSNSGEGVTGNQRG